MLVPKSARLGRILAAALVLSGCAAQASPLTTSGDPEGSLAVLSPSPSSVEPTSQDATRPTYTPSVTTREMTDGILTDFYLPNVMATLRVPATSGPAPLVVVVPGGGWATSDPTDYRPLAESLTASGISTSLITYDTTTNGAQLPRMLDEVACAARWSAFQLTQLGYPPSAVYLTGHSAGGHLVMEVALTGDRFGAEDCQMPPVTIDGVAGIAGIYDLADLGVASDLLPDGGTPEELAEYSPITAADDTSTQLPPVKVMLLSGANDTVVPARQPEALAAALRNRGIEPTVRVLQQEHNMGFPLALELAPIIKQWVLGDAYVPESASAVPATPPADAGVPAASPTDPAAPPAETAAATCTPAAPDGAPATGDPTFGPGSC